MSVEHKEKKPLPTEPYKGVRDFPPEDWQAEQFIFGIWRETARKFGYEEYNASVIEPIELYQAKSGDEIAREQTYNFTDKGDRAVALRPEMTPSVARMVAGIRKSTAFPLRWFSMPNLFRYEKPQKGRLREHWQLNADLFGVPAPDGDVEIISLAYEIMSAFGFKDSDFEIRINHREITNFVFKDFLGLSAEKARKLAGFVDKRDKMPEAEFEAGLNEIAGKEKDKLKAVLNSANIEDMLSSLPKEQKLEKAVADTKSVIGALAGLGITNVRFTQSLVRGFDYYTGMVFEIFDTDQSNPRSVFGGGRYDKLLEIFGVSGVPTVGFGMGDVTLLEMLKSRNLLPAYRHPATIAICVTDEDSAPYANDLAQKIRKFGIGVLVDRSDRKIGDQIKSADRKKIPYVICVGADEVKSGTLKVKELSSGTEIVLREDAIADFIENSKTVAGRS